MWSIHKGPICTCFIVRVAAEIRFKQQRKRPAFSCQAEKSPVHFTRAHAKQFALLALSRLYGCGVNHSIAEVDQNARPRIYGVKCLMGFRIFDVEVSRTLEQSYSLGLRGLATLSSQPSNIFVIVMLNRLVRGYNLIKCMLYHCNPLQYSS